VLPQADNASVATAPANAIAFVVPCMDGR
jgi:hypothetical protein